MSKLFRFMVDSAEVEAVFFVAAGARVKAPVLAGRMPPGRKLRSAPALCNEIQ